MEDKIRAYIDHEFAQVPQSRKTLELKEELINNLVEKYREELNSGKNETAAYNFVISGIGDLSELVDSVRPKPFTQPTPQERRRSALLTSVAVALYILSPIMVVICDEFLDNDTMGILMMFLFVAVATGLLIFNHMTKPTYVKEEDTIVEDFKQWRMQGHRQHAAYKSFVGAFWALVTGVYLLVSFLLRIWAYSWIIFIIAAAIDRIVYGVMQLRGDE